MSDSEPPDGEDVATLYRAHYQALCAFIRRKYGPGPPAPEDVAQAAFAQYASRPNRNEIKNPKAFLYRCASNYALDQRRRQAVSARVTADVMALGAGVTPADADPQRVLEGKDDLAVVLAAIESLDPRRREVLILHSIEELSCAEIARRLGLSPTRVIQLYAQALATCAKALGDQKGET